MTVSGQTCCSGCSLLHLKAWLAFNIQNTPKSAPCLLLPICFPPTWVHLSQWQLQFSIFFFRTQTLKLPYLFSLSYFPRPDLRMIPWTWLQIYPQNRITSWVWLSKCYCEAFHIPYTGERNGNPGKIISNPLVQNSGNGWKTYTNLESIFFLRTC